MCGSAVKARQSISLAWPATNNWPWPSRLSFSGPAGRVRVPASVSSPVKPSRLKLVSERLSNPPTTRCVPPPVRIRLRVP